MFVINHCGRCVEVEKFLLLRRAINEMQSIRVNYSRTHFKISIEVLIYPQSLIVTAVSRLTVELIFIKTDLLLVLPW